MHFMDVGFILFFITLPNEAWIATCEARTICQYLLSISFDKMPSDTFEIFAWPKSCFSSFEPEPDLHCAKPLQIILQPQERFLVIRVEPTTIIKPIWIDSGFLWLCKLLFEEEARSSLKWSPMTAHILSLFLFWTTFTFHRGLIESVMVFKSVLAW